MIWNQSPHRVRIHDPEYLHAIFNALIKTKQMTVQSVGF
jgi:hypothetical protein